MSTEKFITIASALIGAWLYFIGWAYLYNYLRFFHIDIFEIDLSLQYVIIHSAPPLNFFLRHYLLPSVLLLVLPGIAIFFSLTKRRQQLLKSNFSKSGNAYVIYFVSGLSIFIGGFYLARKAGESQARDTWISTAPEVYLAFVTDAAKKIPADSATKKPESGPQSALQEENNRYALRHLLSTRDTHYVFTRREVRRTMNSVFIPDGLVFKIPVKNVEHLHIRRKGGWVSSQGDSANVPQTR